MDKSRAVKPSKVSHRRRPASTPDARENQCISLAIDLAEKRLMDGTAPAQVITHYLKLGSSKERLEKEMLAKQSELIAAKTKALQDAKQVEKLYRDALAAMRRYTGQGAEDLDDEEEE